MKDTQSLHLKAQEHIDCYATTDPLREMSVIKENSDKHEAALKWLALAALHGFNNNTKNITISIAEDGRGRVIAKYRESELLPPGAEVGREIDRTVREITHIEGDKGKMELALGARGSRVDLEVSLKAKDAKHKITLKFPE
jgi:hypothetical protein